MKQITSYITEGLRINKNIKIKKHIEGGLNIQIKNTDEQYYHSIGKDQPIDDYAESPEEAIVMIKRDSDDDDKFYWLKKLDNGNYQASLRYYWEKFIKGEFLLINHQDNSKATENYIKSMYNKQGLILAKVKG